MNRSFPLLLLALALGSMSYGQSYTDALRYSFVSPLGSARFAGTAGSLTPMGVDATTLHTNPAGIGWNRYNTAQVTPGFLSTNTSSLLDFGGNNELSEGSSNVALPSAGVILAGTTRSVNWSTLNFGISVSRMADYNSKVRFSGTSPGSIIEGFADEANNSGGGLDAFSAGLAEPFLILENGFYYSDFFDPNAGSDGQPRGGNIDRNGLYDRSGGMTEIALGFGGNYREKFLWGLSVGIPFFNYDETLTYDETDPRDEIPAFEDASYERNLRASGTGFNIKAGLVYLPTESLRVSAAIHSPTFNTIDETYTTSFGYFYSEDGEALGGREFSPESQAAYNLSTPWRFMLGAGYLIGKAGFVSIDADYADYRGNSISFDDFATANEVSEATNADIDAILSSSIGVRVGGELNLKPLQVRAGIGYRQLPYQEFFNDEDKAILTYGAGVGYSVGKFFVDAAAQYEGYKTFQEVYPTTTVSTQTLLNDRSRLSFLLTVGVRGWNAGF